MRWAILLLLGLAACNPAVNIGNDDSPDGELACALVTPAKAVCPGSPWGEPRQFTSVEDLQQLLVGRWVFCGGEKRYTGRGALEGFPHGAGVEFWSEGTQLHYAYLNGRPPALVRAQEPSRTGTVRLELDGRQGRAVLVSGDGQESLWHAEMFEGQRVLQNAAFDVWNFVGL